MTGCKFTGFFRISGNSSVMAPSLFRSTVLHSVRVTGQTVQWWCRLCSGLQISSHSGSVLLNSSSGLLVSTLISLCAGLHHLIQDQFNALVCIRVAGRFSRCWFTGLVVSFGAGLQVWSQMSSGWVGRRWRGPGPIPDERAPKNL